MTLVRAVALGSLLALALPAFAQIPTTPWTPLWTLPNLPRAVAGDMPVAGDNIPAPGYAYDVAGHALVCWQLATGTPLWSVPLKAEATYFPTVAVSAGYVGVARPGAIEVRRADDGSLVRTIATNPNSVLGLAVWGNRLYAGDKVYAWPEGAAVNETPIYPTVANSDRFSPNGRYFANAKTLRDMATGGTWSLTGERGRFSADSARVYSFLSPESSATMGAVFGQRTSDGMTLWSYQAPDLKLTSMLPLGNVVLVAGRSRDPNGNVNGPAVLLVLSGFTGQVLRRVDDPEFDAGDLASGPRLVAASPNRGKALLLTRSARTWVLRRIDVTQDFVASVSGVDQWGTGDGVEFAGNRPVVYGPVNDPGGGPLSSVYNPDGSLQWRSALEPRPAWPWLSNLPLTGTSFTPDGKYVGTLGLADGLPRTLDGKTGALIAKVPATGVASDRILPLYGGGALGDYPGGARFYQKSGSQLKMVGDYTYALPIGTDAKGTRYVLAGRYQGELLVGVTADQSFTDYMPAGSLIVSPHPRAALSGDLLTTLTVHQPSEAGILARVTATVWRLGTGMPNQLRTVTRDLFNGPGIEAPFNVSAALSPDGRQLLIQPRFGGTATRPPIELVRVSDGKTVAKLSPTISGDPAVDLAISQDGSRAILALQNGSKAVMAMPSRVDTVAAVPESRKRAQVTVRLLSPAPAGGVPVRFRFSPPIGTPPVATTIPEGATSATFRVALAGVGEPRDLRIEAATVGVEDWAATSIPVAPPVPTKLTLKPTLVEGGASTVLRVSLDGPAPSGGLAVALASDQPFVTPPATVTVPEGATYADATVPTLPVEADGTARLTAGGVSIELAVQKALAVSLTPTVGTIKGGESVVVHLSLTRPALAGWWSVSLRDNNAATSLPASVTVAEGATEAEFTVTSVGVTKTQTVTLIATVNGKSGRTTLTVTK